jgi:phosphoglycolate phosphatase
MFTLDMNRSSEPLTAAPVPKYNLVIFDFDGTLADSFPVFLEAWNVLAADHGFKTVADVDIDRLRNYSARQVIAEVGLSWWRLPLVARQLRRFMREQVDRVGLFDDVDLMLHRLKAEGVTVAIVTSNSRENVERILGDENAALIDHYSCSASLFGKRRGTRSVIKASGVSTGEVLCVGDEIRDVDVARDLGLDFAAVSWGYTHPTALEQLTGVTMCRHPLDVVSLAVIHSHGT